MPGENAAPPLLVFLHIPKTAGVNLRQIVRQQYGEANVYVPNPPGDPTDSPYLRYLKNGGDLPWKDSPGYDPNQAPVRELSKVPAARLRSLRAVMGHLWFGFHGSLPRAATYLTVLRDPVERVLSIYYYHAARHGLHMGLEEYLNAARDFEIDNAQTRYLCGPIEGVDVRFTECTPEMLERAKGNLREHFSVVGITERFDESLLLMTRIYGWHLSGYQSYNVNRRRPRGRRVPMSIRERLADHNRYDSQLHAFAMQMFEGQLEAQDPPIDKVAVRRFRRSNLLHRHPTLRRLYPFARPLLRVARSVGEGAKRTILTGSR
jgi:hypothetical protein